MQATSVLNPTPDLIKAITSTQIGQEYRLFISLPENFDDPEQEFPVIYLLDGNVLFGLAKPIIEIQQIIQSLPNMIIVGIGYPESTYMDTLTVRGRDYTHVKLTKEQQSTFDYPFEKTGGASHFLSFLHKEIIPLIEQQYKVDSTDRTLVGYSMSADFALYAMFNQPTLFQRIICISPFVGSLINLEQQFVQENDALPVKLTISIEKPDDDSFTINRIQETEQFLATLNAKRYPDLYTNLRVIEKVDHFQVLPIALTYALQDVHRQ